MLSTTRKFTLLATATIALGIGVTAQSGKRLDTTAFRGGEQSTTTILDKLNELDRYTDSEDENGLDRFRVDQRNWYDFDILTAAVVLDGNLVAAVTDPNSALTLFGPNDRAFQVLAYDLTGSWFYTESQVLGAIVAAVNAGAVDLTNVLTYHVVAGKVMKADVPFNTPVATLNGDTITFRLRLFGLLVELQDNVDDFRNPFLLRTDLDAGNSVIHMIHRVLIPVNVGG